MTPKPTPPDPTSARSGASPEPLIDALAQLAARSVSRRRALKLAAVGLLANLMPSVQRAAATLTAPPRTAVPTSTAHPARIYDCPPGPSYRPSDCSGRPLEIKSYEELRKCPHVVNHPAYEPVCNGCGNRALEKTVPAAVKDHPAGFHFVDPCNAHDKCYGTCGSNRHACDVEFLDHMFDKCPYCHDPHASFFQQIACGACAAIALGYFDLVNSGLGTSAYQDAQVEACSCCRVVIGVCTGAWDGYDCPDSGVTPAEICASKAPCTQVMNAHKGSDSNCTYFSCCMPGDTFCQQFDNPDYGGALLPARVGVREQAVHRPMTVTAPPGDQRQRHRARAECCSPSKAVTISPPA